MREFFFIQVVLYLLQLIDKPNVSQPAYHHAYRQTYLFIFLIKYSHIYYDHILLFVVFLITLH